MAACRAVLEDGSLNVRDAPDDMTHVVNRSDLLGEADVVPIDLVPVVVQDLIKGSPFNLKSRKSSREGVYKDAAAEVDTTEMSEEASKTH